MFALTYGQLRNENFISGIQALASARELPTAVAYNIAKIHELLSKESDLVQSLYQKVIDPFLQKDEKGKWLPSPGMPPGSFKVLDGKGEELDKALQAFYEEKVQVDRPQLKLEVVARYLSPKEMAALAPLFLPIDESKLA